MIFTVYYFFFFYFFVALRLLSFFRNLILKDWRTNNIFFMYFAKVEKKFFLWKIKNKYWNREKKTDRLFDWLMIKCDIILVIQKWFFFLVKWNLKMVISLCINKNNNHNNKYKKRDDKKFCFISVLIKNLKRKTRKEEKRWNFLFVFFFTRRRCDI